MVRFRPKALKPKAPVNGDAHLTDLTWAHGCVLHIADHYFAHFPGLCWPDRLVWLWIGLRDKVIP